ncbi:MAG TPA: GYF domain-containing protein [Polyangiaceae bacterium]|nr:GYF domain-containing protein [Polyangiaceae bacterium]
MADDELWHVRMSPNEVKQLTLEQLDDLFRLEIIEADTLIWQPGMTEWLPLSVVAGLGDEDPEPVNIAVSQPPPNRMAQTQTAWPPVARAAPPSTAPAPPSMRSAPPPLSQRPAPPPLSQRPAPPLASRPAPPPLSQRPAPPPLSQRPVPPSHAPPSSTATSWPPPSAWSYPAPVSPFASTVQEPQRSAPSSRAPAAFATAPVIRAPRNSGGGSWLILLSLAAGAAVTLYRNDLVHGAMRSIGQEGSYVKLETALGGPSFGTPRAVEQMAAATAAITAAAPVSGSATTESSTSTASTSETPKPAETAAAEPAKPAETAAAEPSTSTETPKPEASKPAEAAPRPAAASRPAPHAASAPEKVDPVFKTPKKGKKGKGSEYDPLNPSL